MCTYSLQGERKFGALCSGIMLSIIEREREREREKRLHSPFALHAPIPWAI